MNNPAYFPFCSEKKQKRVKTGLIIALILNMLVLTGMVFYNKLFYLIGGIFSFFAVLFLLYRSCQKYFIKIEKEQLIYHTPENRKNTLKLSAINDIDVTGLHLRFYFSDQMININISDFDPEIVKQIKQYFENFKVAA